MALLWSSITLLPTYYKPFAPPELSTLDSHPRLYPRFAVFLYQNVSTLIMM